MEQSAISVLVVEDVDEMKALLEFLLKDVQGLKISGLARNGFEARLSLSRNRPQIVLLDEVLPGESSHDLLQEIHQQGIPVLLMTSLEGKSSVRALPSGACARITKPGWESIEQDRTRIAQLIFQYSGVDSHT
jgi:DNA-binding NtrC family response regulator